MGVGSIGQTATCIHTVDAGIWVTRLNIEGVQWKEICFRTWDYYQINRTRVNRTVHWLTALARQSSWLQHKLRISSQRLWPEQSYLQHSGLQSMQCIAGESVGWKFDMLAPESGPKYAWHTYQKSGARKNESIYGASFWSMCQSWAFNVLTVIFAYMYTLLWEIIVGWLGFNGILSRQVAAISCLRKFKVC